MTKIQDLRGDKRILGPTNAKRSVSAIKKIARHHSATTVGDVFIFQNHWRGTLGWGTGGYHEIILRDGTVQRCYNDNDVTNGVGNHNGYIYNICVVGNGSFTEAQEKAFEERCKDAMKRFGLTANDVLGHKEFSGHASNSCPGIDMNIVRKRLKGGTVVEPPKAEVKPTTPTPKPVTPKYKEDPFNVRQVTDDVLRVRKEPNTKSAILKTLPKGKQFTPTKIVRNGESVEGYTTWCNTEGGWVSMAYTTPAKATAPTKHVAKPVPAKKYVTLPASAKQWGIYRQGVQPVSKNIFAYLAPSKFGGLTYEIKGWTVANQVALIDTQDFGRVQIYVAKGTGAVIK